LYRYFIIYKPFEMLCQFSTKIEKKTLKDLAFDFPSDAYPVGRLDEDSEGLLILTNDKTLTDKLLNPSFKHKRSYLVQVEGQITDTAIVALRNGVSIRLKEKYYLTLPTEAKILTIDPQITARNPPIRVRKNIPTSWLRLVLIEGKNRQVRKMTAQVGFPTLRLIRESIEDIHITGMKIGEVRELKAAEIKKKLKI
jgi:23S rRNA pseudouridine2457 synthase